MAVDRSRYIALATVSVANSYLALLVHTTNLSNRINALYCFVLCCQCAHLVYIQHSCFPLVATSSYWHHIRLVETWHTYVLHLVHSYALHSLLRVGRRSSHVQSYIQHRRHAVTGMYNLPAKQFTRSCSKPGKLGTTNVCLCN